MQIDPKPVARILVCVTALIAAGCSVRTAFEQGRNADTALREGDDAVADGEYDAGLKSYIRAKGLLLSTRQEGYWIFSDEKKLTSIDEKIKECERLAVEDGLIRVGERYVGGDSLGAALTDELRSMFRENPTGPGARERVVPDELEASCGEERDGRFDVTLTVVVRSAEDEGEFDQDAWGLVRFLMEGGWGHGFCFHTARRFAQRPWMGGETGWGRSGKENAANHFIGLKGKIDRLTVCVVRGQFRQEPGDGYGARGYQSLKAVGPYWRKEPYRSFALGHADAERLNWGEADRIPDATLYGLMAIAAGAEPMPGATAEVGIQ